MLGDVEVDPAHDLDDVGHGVFAEQHAADGALLGQEVVWGDAVTVAPAAVAAGLIAGKSEMRNGHVKSPNS
ncbi:hypothetical protein GCM10027029_18280 [Conyzicola lurida]